MRIRIDPQGTREIIEAGMKALNIMQEDRFKNYDVRPYRIVESQTGEEVIGLHLTPRPMDAEKLSEVLNNSRQQKA